MARARLSSKGQLVIPQEVRERHGWGPGTELELEDRGGVLVLRRAEPPFLPTRFEDVRGCLRAAGPARTVEEMSEGIERLARAMWRAFEREGEA